MTPATPVIDNRTAQDQAASPAPDSVATGNQTIAEQGPRVLAEVDPDNVSGSGRQKNAQLSTQLLNKFNTLGFAEVKEFSREGGPPFHWSGGPFLFAPGSTDQN